MTMSDVMTPPPIPLRRPRLVWAIFLFYAISLGFSLIMQLEMSLGLAKLPPESQALVDSMPMSARLFGYGSGILSMVAATYLWLLRRGALPLFSATLVLQIGYTLWQCLPGGMYGNMFSQNAVMAWTTVFSVCLGMLMLVGIWWYTFHLWRRGVLR